MRNGRARLAVVPPAQSAAPASPPQELGLYPEIRQAANDRERWRRMHERSDRAPAVMIAARARRLFSLGGGVRKERGGFKYDERL